MSAGSEAADLEQRLRRLWAALRRSGAEREANLVGAALSGSADELAAFLVSNELWGGSGSIADQAGVDRGQEARREIETALIALGQQQMSAGRVNERTSMWTSAFVKRNPDGG